MTYPTTETSGAREKAADVAGAAHEQGAAVAGAAKDQLTEVTSTAKEQVAAVAGTASEQARNLIGEAQQEFTSQATAQKEKAVSGLRSLSGDLASMAEQADQGVASHVVGEVAKRSQTLADYLDEREPGHLLDDLRDLGRRRTGSFLLGAAVLGFAGGRLLKGSRSDSGTAATAGATGPGEVSAPAVPATPVAIDTEFPMQDDEPTTLRGTYGSLIETPSLMSADDV